MKYNSLFLVLVAVLIAVPSFGQRNTYNKRSQNKMYNKKARDVFPQSLQYKMTGWYIAPGATFMATNLIAPLINTIKADDATNAVGIGRPGLYFEFGRYHISEYSSLVKYFDYGLSYKSLRGSEVGDGGGGAFGDHFITGHFNLNNVINFSNYNFLGNTLGVNAGYAIIRNAGAAPPRFIGQIHYKFSFGIKMSKKLIVIPGVETPILNLYPFESGRSSLKYFSSRYRPVIFSVRFLFLRPKQEYCPPVINPAMPVDMPQNWEE